MVRHDEWLEYQAKCTLTNNDGWLVSNKRKFNMTYQTNFVERFNGFKVVEQPVTVEASNIQEARIKFGQLSRETRKAWMSKRIKKA